MADKKVIIVDETVDEEQELTEEEFEEIQRNERLKKLFKSRKKYSGGFWYYLSKVTNALAILGIMIGMLLESGSVFTVCLVIMLISSIINYIFYK